MTHVTLMSGPERRRRWSAAEQREILMAAFSPGAVVADVARQYEVATSLIYKWRREVLAARFYHRRTQRGLERFAAHSFRRLYGLSVVMRVNNQRTRRVRYFDLAEHDGRHIRNFEQLRFDAAPLEHLLNGGGIAANVGQVTGYVGQGQQVHELNQNFTLVLLPIFARGFYRRQTLSECQCG